MTPAFSARRRADEFEALLSRDRGVPSSADTAQYAALLEVVAGLRAMPAAIPAAMPRAEFSATLRERLMLEADTVLVPQPAAPSRLAMPRARRARDRRLAAALGGVAMVGAAATMAVAAQSALPGESLYGVKRGMEAAEVRLASDDATRGRALLAQAETRLTELEALSAGEGGSEQLVPSTLEAFTEQSRDGVRTLLDSYAGTGAATDAQAARDFTAQSMERLDALHAEFPDTAQSQFLTAGRTLSDLDLEVSTSCAACSGGIATLPDFVLSSAEPVDLLAGLDADTQPVEGAPISGQDLRGVEVPESLDVEPGLPTPTALPTPTPLPTTNPTNGLPQPPVTPHVDNPIDEVKGTVNDTVDQVTDQLDGVTGGALGGLTSDVNDATSGLIDEVTGAVDSATSGTVGGTLP